MANLPDQWPFGLKSFRGRTILMQISACSGCSSLWDSAQVRLTRAIESASEDPEGIVDLATAIPQARVEVAIAAKLLQTDREMSKQLLNILA